MPGSALVSTKFIHLSTLPENPPSLARARPVSTCTFGDESLAILFGSQDTRQLYDTENQPSQELINDMDKEGRTQYSNKLKADRCIDVRGR